MKREHLTNVETEAQCQDYAERAMRCARNEGGGNTYGPEFARVMVCNRLANNIIALREGEAAEYEEMLASFYACHPAD